MKSLLVDNQYANALLEFINNEVISGEKEIEGVIAYNNNFINEENIYLYECFQALNKKYSIEDIKLKLNLWFPYGLLISANDFNYEVVKKYIMFLSKKYNFPEKELFFNPQMFFQSEIKTNLIEEIQEFFINYESKNNFITKLIDKLNKSESVQIEINENKFLKTKIILNVTEKNKHLLEYFLDEEIFNGNSKINYAGKEMLLLEYLLLRSLSSSQQIIKKMMLQINKLNLTEVKNHITEINLSYLNNFKEQMENFKDNMNLLERKMILLKFEEEDKDRGSGSSSKGVIKI